MRRNDSHELELHEHREGLFYLRSRKYEDKNWRKGGGVQGIGTGGYHASVGGVTINR